MNSIASTDHAPRPPAIVGTALVIDDVAVNRILLRHTLTALGYAVIEATDGHEAIDRIDRETFDVVFLDWELPGLRGDKVAAHLRAHPAHGTAPVIAITSDTSETMRGQCREAGIVFLAKAFDSASVRRALAESRKAATQRKEIAPEEQTPASFLETPAAPRPHALIKYAALFPGGLPEAIRCCRREFDRERRLLLAAVREHHWTRAARSAHNLGSLGAMTGLSRIKDAARASENALRLPADAAKIAATLACFETALADANATLDTLAN